MRTTSIVVPDQKRPWILIAAAVAVVLAVAATIAVVDIPGNQPISARGIAEEVVPALPQAPWKMNVFASPVNGKLSPAAKKAVARQGPELRALVKKVYDTLFVRPNRLSSTLKQSFSGSAAAAFKEAGAGASKAGRASTKLRRASIGIQAAGARTAVAAVTVRAVGDTAKATPVLHRSTLWLERSPGGWKVVAFDVRQGAAPKPKGREAKKGADTKRARQSGKKGKR